MKQSLTWLTQYQRGAGLRYHAHPDACSPRPFGALEGACLFSHRIRKGCILLHSNARGSEGPFEGEPPSLVLSHTRELALQTYQQIKRLCKDKGFRICILTKSTIPLETDNTTRRFGKVLIAFTLLVLIQSLQTSFQRLYILSGYITLET
jgi:hypothetical protein